MSLREHRTGRIAAQAVFLLVVLVGLPRTAGATPAAGTSDAASTSSLADEALKVTSIIKCFCGTCVHPTLQECTCGVASRERERVEAALAEGETPESLIAAYIAEHGPQVRIVPERVGWNYVGWIVPFVGTGAGLLGLLFVLLVWHRRAYTAMAPVTPRDDTPMDESDNRYRGRLARELEELDR